MDATQLIGKGLNLLGYGPEVREVLTRKILESIQKVKDLEKRSLEVDRKLDAILAKLNAGGT